MAANRKIKALEAKRDPHVLEDIAWDDRALEKHILRFDSRRRRSVRKLIATSSRIADIAHVFPGLLYVLATRQGSATGRAKALELIESGASLKTVAKTVELPFWLRRLGPEAFSGTLGDVPKSDLFCRRIVNHLPRRHDNSAFWLKSITFAANACDDYFSLWLAQQPIFSEPGEPDALFGVLAAWAWCSNYDRGRQPSRSLIVTPWRPEMALDTAVCAAKSWLNRLRLVLQLQPGILQDPWLEGGEAGGLEFTALLDHDQILQEAQMMHNCADQYAERLSKEKCRLFSVSRRGLRIATLEVGPHPREAGVLTINQLKSRHNLPASVEVWKAAHTWLGTQTSIKRTPGLDVPDRPLDQDVWEQILSAYRQNRAGAPWLPAFITRTDMHALDENINHLARRAGITSWLFT